MTVPFDMALLRRGDLVAPWGQPGTDVKADVQAMMAHWERDALDIGVEVEWPHDLVTRLTVLLAPPNSCRRHWRRYLGEMLCRLFAMSSGTAPWAAGRTCT